MKKLLFTIGLLSILTSLQVGAVRAYPHPKTIRQADGTTITLVGHGDEFNHHVTTTDGYTVMRGSDGIYRYAVKEGDRLKASAVRACDGKDRTSYDSLFLTSVKPHLKPEISSTGKKLMKLNSRNNGLFSPGAATKNGRRTRAINSKIPYRGLVILVNFTDRKFSRGDQARQLADDMMNKPNRTSYIDNKLMGEIKCTGSVRDYFADNSGGMFVPEFDVVGPIDVDVNQYYINGTEYTFELCLKVLEKINPDVDFSRYDSDGDGEVDMFYLLYAGYSSSYEGNDERLVWPHAGDFDDSDIDLTYDGVRFGRFACSSEIFGWHSDGDIILDNIGVIVHEFSHVLGFQDHYDVSGYLNETPNTWDIMAAGNYNGFFNDTPCGYNSYEKYAAGFLTPRTVDANDHNASISLRALSASNDAVRIKSTQDSTVFMVENRQLEKWDKYLPGHGMLVWRVDSCDRIYWEHNALNVNNRLHFKLVRACGATMTMFRQIEDMDYDPFPGTRNVTELSNYTRNSHLLTDWKYPSTMNIRNIREEEGVINFELQLDPQAESRPCLFNLKELYKPSGISADGGAQCEWTMRSGYVTKSNREVPVVYNLIPDAKGIAASNTKYKDGLYAAYTIGTDRNKVFIEPTRVALLEDYGVWLVDFNNLDKGGAGAITLNITPYGDLTLADPESVIGYCLLPKTSVVVDAEEIVERFGMVKNICFDTSVSVEDTFIAPESTADESNHIFNLQGMKITNPRKGEIYIIKGKKVLF